MIRSFRLFHKYTKTHEWLIILSPGHAKVGISKFAQNQLGEVVYCDLPSVGAKLDRNAVLCTLESVKAVGEVYCPVSSVVKAVNPGLKSSPAELNTDPEGAGWLVEIEFDPKRLIEGELLDGNAYQKLCSDIH